MTGELLKKAPSSFIFNSARLAWKPEEIPEIGDIIVFARYEGTIVTGEDGDEYRILEDKSIQAFYKKSAQIAMEENGKLAIKKHAEDIKIALDEKFKFDDNLKGE